MALYSVKLRYALQTCTTETCIACGDRVTEQLVLLHKGAVIDLLLRRAMGSCHLDM